MRTYLPTAVLVLGLLATHADSAPAAIEGKDVSAPTRPGGLVDRIIKAARIDPSMRSVSRHVVRHELAAWKEI
jgi:hypothetical protein